MADKGSTQRKRGIQASRRKLTHALSECGLRTQAALAEKIADAESLDTPPKDMVNRAFRELPVELQTLERIANALNVPAYTLYKSADESEIPSVSIDTRSGASFPVWLTTGFGVVMFVSVFFWWQARGPVAIDEDSASPGAVLTLGALSLVVLPVAGDIDSQFGNALRTALSRDFNVASQTVAGLTQSLSPGATADLLRTDVTVDAQLVTIGRLQAVRVFLLADGVRRQVWSESFPRGDLNRQLAMLVERSRSGVVREFVNVKSSESFNHFPLAPTQDDYLEGEYLLDQPSSELNMRRAQSRFEAALRQDANYALAHAGLCQSLLDEHWLDDEARALRDAARACGQALQLNPNHPVVAGAYAHFLHRTGRTEEAISVYQKTIKLHPFDGGVLTGLASTYLDAYRTSGERSDLLLAKETATQAAKVDPFVWKPLFNLAVMEWMDNRLEAAIAASEQALERNENEFVLGNLGTFYICQGNINKALARYQRGKNLAPNSYIGDEYLGMAQYYLGNFSESAVLRKRAIDSIAEGNPEIHEMWGNLGDSYRQSGQQQQAVSAYVRAVEIAERDYLRGTRPAADGAARAYYYTMLTLLKPARDAPTIEVVSDADLEVIAASLKEATAHRRMAAVWFHRGEIEKAIQQRDKATVTCPGYRKFPELFDW